MSQQWKTAGKVRMTPKGKWVANTAYEILDCVTSENGLTYYIAKQDVPSSGIALTNTDYWVAMIDVSDSIDDIDDSLDDLISRVEDLEYIPVEISSASVSVPSGGIAEMGSTVAAVTVGWALKGTPVGLTLNGTAVEPATSTSKALSGLSLTTNTDFTLIATDAREHTSTKVAKLYFYNQCYYGVAAIPSSVNSEFIAGLASKILTGTKVRNITLNAGSGQYIWYAVPKRLGTCNFNVGGFDGGFQAPQTVSVTNESGYTEDYYVYRSTNANLGDTTVKVS